MAMSTDPAAKENALAGKTKTVFNREASRQGKMPAIPEAIRKTKPELTLEMPGPMGAAMRRHALARVSEQDLKRANGAKANILADNRQANLIRSKENSRGVLKASFKQARTAGRAKGPFNNNAR
jgi:hypothetical protein